MNISLKKLLIAQAKSALRRRDYLLTARWELANVVFAEHLCSVFSAYGVQLVVDVGGNLGQYTEFLRKSVGFRGTVITFEPASKYAEALRSKAKDDGRWSIVQCALGRDNGVAQLNITRSPGLNSLRSPKKDALNGNYWTEGDVVGVEDVPVRRLDDVLREQGVDVAATPTYLKVDTQGYDLEVLAGASGSLPAVRALQTEASLIPIYEGMPSYVDTLQYLTGQNFSVSGLFPVFHDPSLRLLEFDCVAVNNSFAADCVRRT